MDKNLKDLKKDARMERTYITEGSMMNKKERIEVQLNKKERQYIKVYKDFFRSELLTRNEKLVYIALKDFVSFGEDCGEVFPSVQLLCKHCDMTQPTITKTIRSLEKKGLVKKVRRGLTKTNIYTLIDNEQIWKSTTEEEMQVAAASEIELTNEQMIAELKRRGAIKIVEQKKEVSSTADQSKDETSNTLQNIQYSSNDNTVNINCQQITSIDKIKEQIEYNCIVQQYQKEELDAIVQIMYDTMTSTAKQLKIANSMVNTDIVAAAFEKIDMLDITHVIETLHDIEQSTIIKNHEAYIRTMLYKAKTQSALQISNLIRKYEQ